MRLTHFINIDERSAYTEERSERAPAKPAPPRQKRGERLSIAVYKGRNKLNPSPLFIYHA